MVYWDRASTLRRVARAGRDRVVIAALAGQLWGQRQLFLPAPTALAMEGRNRWDRQTVTSRWLARRHLVPPDTPFAAVAEEINAFAPRVIFSHPDPGVVRWRIVPLRGADREALRQRLVERGRQALGDATRVEVEFLDDIPSTPQGKFLRVVTVDERG